MPAKNSQKQYSENGYYHLYSRGVAKNEIFLDEQDYGVFLSYLKEYLSLKKDSPFNKGESFTHGESFFRPHRFFYQYQRKNYHGEIELLAFCLMPNHFHLLVKQKKFRSIESFMRSLLTRYSGYFNKQHRRVGHLFQGVYRGILVREEEYFWWLSRYIHRNPAELNNVALSSYPYSSYPAYLGMEKIDWLNTGEILEGIKDYERFVEVTEINENVQSGNQPDQPEDMGLYELEECD